MDMEKGRIIDNQYGCQLLTYNDVVLSLCVYDEYETVIINWGPISYQATVRTLTWTTIRPRNSYNLTLQKIGFSIQVEGDWEAFFGHFINRINNLDIEPITRKEKQPFQPPNLKVI